MRPIFCGNFEYDARQSELERLFKRYGRVERVDMKSGFAFIYMEDERDAEDAIRALDRVEFGRKGRRLRVEWTKQERGIRRPGGGGASRRSASTRPSKTLFVINFDPHHTRIKDLERHFEPYGRIVNVRIRRNFAFVQYEAQEDATRALEATNLSKLMDRVISVEYAVRDDDERRNGYSPNRSRDRSPDRRSYDRRRSPSPYQRGRGSPDYGHGPSRSPNLRERASPNYGRHRSPSPYRRDRASPEYGRASSHSPCGKERSGVNHGDGPTHSPYHKESSLDNGHHPGGSPYQKERSSPSNGYDHVKTSQGHSPYGRERINLDNGRGSNYSPDEEGGIPENGQHTSRNSMPDERDSPHDAEAESAKNEGYNQSSPADE